MGVFYELDLGGGLVPGGLRLKSPLGKGEEGVGVGVELRYKHRSSQRFKEIRRYI